MVKRKGANVKPKNHKQKYKKKLVKKDIYDLGIPKSEYPFVSVLTPTYNRSKFIPALKKCFIMQDYPQDKMEWIIVDDGSEPVHDLFNDMTNVRYIYLDEKVNIGQKRNMCNELAKGDFMVCMDDDDYYPPTRVSSAIKALYNTNYHLAGSSILFMYYADIKEIYEVGPYGPNHCTNGTMAYTKEYANTHKYDNYVTHAEETSFLDNYAHPCFQMKADDVMLVMSHSNNTYDKRGMRNGNKYVKRSRRKIQDIIKNKDLLDFYKNAN